MWRLQENETQGKLFYVDDGIIQSRPEIRVHDGTDSTLWTGADVTGTTATYNSTTQAYAVTSHWDQVDGMGEPRAQLNH